MVFACFVVIKYIVCIGDVVFACFVVLKYILCLHWGCGLCMFCCVKVHSLFALGMWSFTLAVLSLWVVLFFVVVIVVFEGGGYQTDFTEHG